MKSSVEEIRARFDRDVERFSNLETGQSSTMDAQLVLDVVTHAAAVTTPHARNLLDIGCGAGNYALKLLVRLPGLAVTLLDLSRPMLERAASRLANTTVGGVQLLQGDIREVELAESGYDIVFAAAVFHHLRTDEEWRHVFRKCFRALRPGGSLWIADLVEHSQPEVGRIMWARYGDYLTALRGPAYREDVLAYIEAEDSPTPLLYQLDLLQSVGFSSVEVLHKNACFAAFGGRKPPNGPSV